MNSGGTVTTLEVRVSQQPDVRAVWKFELHPGRTDFEWPQGAEILTAAAQGYTVYVWVLVRPNLVYPTERRSFVTLGTGHRWDGDTLRYIGTAFLPDGLVFHAFEVGAQS
jgi:hypothetical protein